MIVDFSDGLRPGPCIHEQVQLRPKHRYLLTLDLKAVEWEKKVKPDGVNQLNRLTRNGRAETDKDDLGPCARPHTA